MNSKMKKPYFNNISFWGELKTKENVAEVKNIIAQQFGVPVEDVLIMGTRPYDAKTGTQELFVCIESENPPREPILQYAKRQFLILLVKAGLI